MIKKWKDVKTTQGGNCTSECILICLNNYLSYYLPICAQARGTGPELNACRKKKLSTTSTWSLKGVTRGIPYTIGIIFNNNLGNILMILLEIVSLLP